MYAHSQKNFPHPIVFVTHLWIYTMYVYMYVRKYVCTYLRISSDFETFFVTLVTFVTPLTEITRFKNITQIFLEFCFILSP